MVAKTLLPCGDEAPHPDTVMCHQSAAEAGRTGEKDSEDEMSGHQSLRTPAGRALYQPTGYPSG
jgi:hypothetical protein